MALAAHQLNLFGLDLGRVWRTFRAGLREAALWPALSWLRPTVPVRLLMPDGGERVCDGRSLSEVKPAAAQVAGGLPVACLLPDSLVLVRRFRVPDLPDYELAAMAEMELVASTPFAPGETVWGWGVERATGAQQLVLAFASRAHVADYLRQRAPSAEVEVWVAAGEEAVILQGYAEAARSRTAERIRRRRIVAAAFSLSCVLALPAAPFMLQRSQVFEAQDRLLALQTRAAPAVEARTALSKAQEGLVAVAELNAKQPDVLGVLETLSRLTPDTAYFYRLEINGDLVRGVGDAANASALLEAYSNAPELGELRSPQPISRVPTRQVDAFSVEFRYRPGKVGHD